MIFLVCFLLLMMLAILFSGGPYESPYQKGERHKQYRKDAKERWAKQTPGQKMMSFIALAFIALLVLDGLLQIP